MKRSSIQEIERHQLSDGGHAYINKLGRTYSFARTYNSFTQAPDVTTGIGRNTAYKMLADTLRDDYWRWRKDKMATAIIKKWQITVSVTRTLEYPVEDNEDAEAIWTWANSLEGKRFMLADFLKRLHCFGSTIFSNRNADMEIEDIELKEYEVKSTDTDPRV